MDKSERSSSIEGKIPVTTSTDSKTSTTTTTVLSTTSMITTTSTTLTASIVESRTEGKNLTLESSITPPTIVMSSVTPPSVSPTVGSNLPLPGTSTSGSSSPVGSPNVSTPTHPMLTTRRDSTTQVSCFVSLGSKNNIFRNLEKRRKTKFGNSNRE